ncbi:MAG TPA: MFS transporter [Candidatus Nanopelagicales bacterium]|nr:MFS transporter [Candidatus Nanopelagicales bacterium]
MDQAQLTWRHRAWVVAGITFVVLVAAAAFRSSTGVLIEPVATDLGWSVQPVSFAVTVNLVLYGLVAPFAAALMEKFGVRRVVAVALVLMSAGMALSTVVSQPWQLVASWGLLMGLGVGCMALVFGAIVAGRWFVARRGLVMGVFSTAYATGSLLFLPVIARVSTTSGWRYASIALAVLALLLVPFVLWLLRERPSDLGLRPYGAPKDWVEPEALDDRGIGPARVALLRLREAARTRAFWLLAAGFFVCGWSTNGLVGTHFISAAHDHGLPITTGATLLAFIGIFDVIGTIGSGWLTDRYDGRVLLLVYYGLRGVSLLLVHLLWAPTVQPPMFFFVVLYGLDWVATVPPTVALCRECFGVERAGVVFGWVFASHMVGAGISAFVAGAVRESTGSYDLAWWVAGALCLVAAVASYAVPRGDALTSRAPDPDPELTPA